MSVRCSTNARGTFTVSGSRDDRRKVACAHNSWRTSAPASERRSGGVCGTTPLAGASLCSASFAGGQRGLRARNNPNSSAGVVRRIAISDHCLCLGLESEMPRHTSWKVTSSCQHITNQERIFCGSALRACLVRVRVRMFLYALFYEKDIPN